MNFIHYRPPNWGVSFKSTDNDLCWRINPEGLVTPAVVGAVCWARNHFRMSDAQQLAIFEGLGLEYHHPKIGGTVLRPQDAHRVPLFTGSDKRSLKEGRSTTPFAAFSLTTPACPLSKYDAVEVYPCLETAHGIERFEDNEHAPAVKPHYWSVALHLEAGHIETIADFPAQLQAEMFGEIMRGMLLLARRSAGLDASHLQPRPVTTGLFLCLERNPEPDPG